MSGKQMTSHYVTINNMAVHDIKDQHQTVFIPSNWFFCMSEAHIILPGVYDAISVQQKRISVGSVNL